MIIRKQAKIIQSHYLSHNARLKIKVAEIIEEERRVIFRIKLKKGTRENLVFDRAGDIQTALEIPLFQVFKEGMKLNLMISDKPMTENNLIKMLINKDFPDHMILPIALGYDMRGRMYYADLGKFPHCLYGGTSGSGKSVGLKALILSIALKQPIDRANLVIIDTGTSNLDMFAPLPHLSYKIVKDEKSVLWVIQSLYDEMNRRIQLPQEELALLPAIICVNDEFVNLISNLKELNLLVPFISRLSDILRKGRHAKIHMVMATQEANRQDMLINLNNIHARMAFATSNFYNSRSILGESGAEKLSGKGAMIFKSMEQPSSINLQGAFISPEKIEQIMADIVSQDLDTTNKFVIPEMEETNTETPLSIDLIIKEQEFKQDPNKIELAEIVMWTLSQDFMTADKIKERFVMGNRANEIMDKLFELKIVSNKNAKQRRKVLMSEYEELSEEIIELLEYNNYTAHQIREVFNVRRSLKES
jgi:S-DNA-T family DNA segregation ATPase FtsK/SpoIIIE